MKAVMDTDIIIPTYRPGQGFIRLLDRLRTQSRRPHKLIIINTEEELMPSAVKERIAELDSDRAEAFPGGAELIHIKKKDFDHAATRNLGVSRSEAESFICMTDDAMPADDHLVERLTDALSLKGPSGETVALAYARQLAEEGATERESFTRTFNYPDVSRIKTAEDIKSLGIKAFFASNVCCAYKRDIFDSLAGFTSPAVFNEDMVYAAGALKAGYAVAYEASARVIHSHGYGPIKQLHRNFDLGMSQTLRPETFSGIRSEGEGIRLVRSTAMHLVRCGRPLEIPALAAESGAKYMGYLLGKHFRSLPRSVVYGLCSNRSFLDRMYGRMDIS